MRLGSALGQLDGSLGRIVLMGHSLGARLVLHALADLERRQTREAGLRRVAGPGLCGTAVFFGAAQASPQDDVADWASVRKSLSDRVSGASTHSP